MNRTKLMSKEPYITVTEGMSGHFAVLVAWNPELGGFWEPYQTGIGRYRERSEAIAEGRDWAELEGLQFEVPHEAQN